MTSAVEALEPLFEAEGVYFSAKNQRPHCHAHAIQLSVSPLLRVFGGKHPEATPPLLDATEPEDETSSNAPFQDFLNEAAGIIDSLGRGEEGDEEVLEGTTPWKADLGLGANPCTLLARVSSISCA